MKQRLEKWIRSQLFTERESGKCTGLTLKHLPVGNKSGHEVALYEVPTPLNDEAIEAILSSIVHDAGIDSTGVGGTQSYVLLSFHGEMKNQTARFSFRIQGEAGQDDGFDSEPPTKSGLVAQVMRHNEALMKMAIGGQSDVMNHMTRALNRLGEQVESMEGGRLKQIELVETLMSEQHTRDLESRKAEHHEQLSADLLNNVKLLTPAIVGRLTGNIQGAKDGNLKQMVSALTETITPEQLQELSNVLNPAQAIAFIELAKQASSDPSTEQQ